MIESHTKVLAKTSDNILLLVSPEPLCASRHVILSLTWERSSEGEREGDGISSRSSSTLTFSVTALMKGVYPSRLRTCIRVRSS